MLLFLRLKTNPDNSVTGGWKAMKRFALVLQHRSGPPHLRMPGATPETGADIDRQVTVYGGSDAPVNWKKRAEREP
jgi:hypothetical protein